MPLLRARIGGIKYIGDTLLRCLPLAPIPKSSMSEGGGEGEDGGGDDGIFVIRAPERPPRPRGGSCGSVDGALGGGCIPLTPSPRAPGGARRDGRTAAAG
uniref:Uncharacterized protein n=1 Tax=Oryza sativa subsp. japonica TaxID=39947 RepID=Q8W329_ORYSJ|nr:hypothetical protein [Oryza sativa Japonica Group]